MKIFTPMLLAAVFVVGVCADSSGRASAASTPNSLTMTCAQVQDHIRKHGQTLLATGKESGNYSFDYADCAGTVPGIFWRTLEAFVTSTGRSAPLRRQPLMDGLCSFLGVF